MSEPGRIECLCGPMFSGKTSKLQRRLRRAQREKRVVQVFKPVTDDRYDAECVCSHDKDKCAATVFDPTHPEEILEKLRPDADVVGIDEVMWCAPPIVTVLDAMAERGIRVIVAGLDLDFKGDPFGPMPLILCIADEAVKLAAVCECGKPATRSQRLTKSKERDEVGGADKYAAACRVCHTI